MKTVVCKEEGRKVIEVRQKEGSVPVILSGVTVGKPVTIEVEAELPDYQDLVQRYNQAKTAKEKDETAMAECARQAQEIISQLKGQVVINAGTPQEQIIELKDLTFSGFGSFKIQGKFTPQNSGITNINVQLCFKSIDPGS